MWVGPTEMWARFPIGARAGRGARRLENVPPSLSEISTPAKNATGHSTGARRPTTRTPPNDGRALAASAAGTPGQNPTGHKMGYLDGASVGVLRSVARYLREAARSRFQTAFEAYYHREPMPCWGERHGA
jgi:hypothetical protein